MRDRAALAALLQRHLRAAQRRGEREPERREQLGDVVGGNDDRPHAVLVAARLTLAEPSTRD